MQLVRRACDGCRRKKTKCDGENPCGSCQRSNIPCSWVGSTAANKARSLRSMRIVSDVPKIQLGGNVDAGSSQTVSRLFQTTTAQHGQPHMPQVYPSLDPDVPIPSSEPQQMLLAQPHAGASWPAQPFEEEGDSAVEFEHARNGHARVCSKDEIIDTTAQTGGLAFAAQQERLSAATFTPIACLFVEHLYPLIPLVNNDFQRSTVEVVTRARLDRAVYSFLCALSAVTIAIMRSQFIFQPSPFDKAGSVFVEKCLSEFDRVDTVGRANIMAVTTTCLLSLFHWHHERQDLAWYYLNESITLVQMSGFDREGPLEQISSDDSQQQRYLYWTLLMMERKQSLRHGTQPRLTDRVRCPTVASVEHPLAGFCANARLLASMYPKISPGGVQNTTYWGLQTLKVIKEVRQMLPSFPTPQRFSAFMSCLWVQLHVWKTTRAQSYQSGSYTTDSYLQDEINRDMPMGLLVELCATLCHCEPRLLESLGIDVYLDAMDIANAVVDRLMYTENVSIAVWVGKMQYLNRLMGWLNGADSQAKKTLAQLSGRVQFLRQSLQQRIVTGAQYQFRAQPATSESNVQSWLAASALQQQDNEIPPLELPQAALDSDFQDSDDAVS